MFGVIFGIAMFRVVAVPLPAQYGSEAGVALGANGSVAVTLKTARRDLRVGIVRPDGTTTYLPLPPLAIIKKQIYVEAPPGFSTIVLASDGTPFVSIGSCFEGIGGGGCNQALFVWTGAWHPLPHPKSKDQFAIVGAQTLGTYLLEDDYGNRSAAGDKNLDPTHAYLYRKGQRVDLGTFAATSLRRNYISATDSHETNVMDPQTPPPSPPAQRAVEFAGTTLKLLGAGVPYAVNARGEAVGDDEVHLGSPGRPMLWMNDHAVLLSPAKGIADAINDAGLIAGTANGHPFVSDAHDPQHRVYPIDNLLVDRSWHVVYELGVANTGRLLVVARRSGGAPRLMLLEPVRDGSNER